MGQKIDFIRSAKLAAQIHAQPKCCWRNSLLALVAAPDLLYCEGFVVLDRFGIVIEHGWLQDRDGVVVDVTLHDSYAPSDFFPAAIWPSKEALRILTEEREGETPLIFPPLHDPRFVEAYRLAWTSLGVVLGK